MRVPHCLPFRSYMTRTLAGRVGSFGVYFGVPLICFGALSCAGKKTDFGTLPQVSIPIEGKPEQDPTLFREQTDFEKPPTTTDPPDPKPARSRDQYEFLVEYQRGKVKVLSVKEIQLAQPESTARRVGRFALELWSGAQLIDRVRFDFPLLGATRGDEEDPLGSGLSAQAKVRIPASSRARRARILDRKTREEVEFSWPPEAPFEAPSEAASAETSGP